jgi:hypothetical protein
MAVKRSWGRFEWSIGKPMSPALPLLLLPSPHSHYRNTRATTDTFQDWGSAVFVIKREIGRISRITRENPKLNLPSKEFI